MKATSIPTTPSAWTATACGCISPTPPPWCYRTAPPIGKHGAGATLYLPETIVPMLPAEAVPRLGLGLSEVTPALSFGLTLDADGVVTDVEIAPSRVRVQRLSYEEVELRLDEEPFRTLHELAQRHRTRRRANRAVFIDLPEVKMQVADGQVAIKPLPARAVGCW